VLQCRKVWMPIVLIVMALLVVGIAIWQKFQALYELAVELKVVKTFHKVCFI